MRRAPQYADPPTAEKTLNPPTRVLRERALKYSVWIMEPGGTWFRLMDTMTRRGGEREARAFVARLRATHLLR